MPVDEFKSALLSLIHRGTLNVMIKFTGTLDGLKEIVATTGREGDWLEKPHSCWGFRSRDGAGLNWSETKGTIWFDGPKLAQAQLSEAIIPKIPGASSAASQAAPQQPIFVVHGHDSTTREQLELVLHKLGLQPFVLQNTDGAGLTIIENLERMIGKNASSAFGIVLLTPDDIGYAKKDGETEAKPRARQNVILEMGMLLASLTRERVAILQKGMVEHPSDVNGIIYIQFKDHVKEAVPRLASRLQTAGLTVSPDKIANASS